MRRYVEVSTNGIDETLQGISTSPFGSPAPTFAGLRIPPLALTGPTLWQNRYLFLLATRTVSKPCIIRGIRQLLTLTTPDQSALIRTDLDNGTAVASPVEFTVSSPRFKFLDGNVSWHLVREPNSRRRNAIPPLTDTTSFRFLESDGPALLYQTFTAAAGQTNPVTGAPLFYPTALTGYTPPPIWWDWQPLAEDLFTFNDLRFPWDDTPAWGSVEIPVPVFAGEQRVSLYASVLQTTAQARTIPNYPNPLPVSATLPPEVGFILTNFNLSTPVKTLYGSVAGALIFEDEEAEFGGAPC